jgi:hypothetical protein
MSDPGWKEVNLWELGGSAAVSLGVGMLRMLVFIREKRKVRWVDVLLEPGLAMFAGCLIWLLTEHFRVPELLQTALVSLGAWGGPRTIHMLELKYFGGRRAGEQNETSNRTPG